MNCEIIRRRLLGSERPDQPSGEVRLHLAGCPGCLAYQRRLAGIERLIPRLPVPAAPARAALLQHLLAAPAPGATRPAQPPPLPPAIRPTLPLRPPPRARAREGGRQKLALASALAAALVVFAVGLWAWPQHEPAGAPDPLASYHHKRDELLRTARTPRERVEALADYAEHLVQEACDHADDAGQLAQLARFCNELIRKDLLTHARALPVVQRAEVLRGVAGRLGRLESSASGRAAEVHEARPASAESLRAIAAAAARGERDLLALSRGERV